MPTKKSTKKVIRKSAAKKVSPSAASLPAPAALLVGLTHVNPDFYGPDENGDPWDGRNGCWGCDDDVANMRNLLEREGYQITTLLDEQATIPAIERALRRAAENAVSGSTFLFYYSGHGGQIKDNDRDETDGEDETLCLFDGQMRDDVLNEVWTSFPKGSAIYMLADCCHSGTNFRTLGRSGRPVPVDFGKDLLGDPDMKAALLHLSGCRDDQESAGYENGGLFTTTLVKIWDKGRYRGTWDTFHDAISAQLPAYQCPMGNLYGPAASAEALAALRPFEPLPAGRATQSGVRGLQGGRTSPDGSPERVRGMITLEQLAKLAPYPDSRSFATRAPRGPVALTATPSLDDLGRPDSREFVSNVQTRLAHYGLYDFLAIDGSTGPFTDWALGQFKALTGTRDEIGIGPRTAHALLNTDVESILPMDLRGNNLACRTLRLMQRLGHWICRHPDCENIVYLEGVDPDGEINDDRPNVFNDLRMLITLERGKPKLSGSWEGTTEPGKYWTENRMNSKGAARIAFGQYYAWSPGDYHGVDALRQASPITVYRDDNEDYRREGDVRDTGNFYIHHHGGYDLPVSNLGNSSAGCLVGRSMRGHREFMEKVRADVRFRASAGYRFTTTVMDGKGLRDI